MKALTMLALQMYMADSTLMTLSKDFEVNEYMVNSSIFVNVYNLLEKKTLM
jgi:hypothetical protein